MAFEAGTKLGPYEIEAPAGEGGMGEVYRARDTRLDRKVAIKILPDDVAGRADRRARFEREARAIASLNHPNICSLFDVGNHEGNTYLVLEFVEGETLAAAIARSDRSRSHGEGARSMTSAPSAKRPGIGRLDRVYKIAIEIAEALEAAHRQGFIHRDLKPANVMLTRDGVKLLDFGLAKSVASVDSDTDLTASVHKPDSGEKSASDLSTQRNLSDLASHTASMSSRAGTVAALTQPDSVLGTLRYAAPEQVQGKKVDRRTDIFSFGAVLYEMLTGAKAFDGHSDVSLIAAILEHDPKPPSQLRHDIPPSLEKLVLECLSKSPDERWQSAGDVARQLRALASTDEVERGNNKQAEARRGSTRRLFASGIALGAVLCATVLLLVKRPPPPPKEVAPEPPPLLRVSVQAPGMLFPARMALSPDGRQLAYIGRATPGGNTAIFLRPMNSPKTTVVAQSDGASDLFWSPDSTELGFVVHRSIHRVGIAPGSTRRLVNEVGARLHGVTWGPGGLIVFSQKSGELRKVSVGGDELGLIFEDGVSRRYPHFFPGSTRLLYERWREVDGPDKSAGFIANVDGTDERMLHKTATSVPLVDATGRALFMVDDGLLSLTLDRERFTLMGAPVRVLEEIETSRKNGFSISNEGTLAYLSTEARTDELVWVDRKGKTLETHATNLRGFSFSLSSDEKQVLISGGLTDKANRGCHLFDLRTNTTTLLKEQDNVIFDDPIWSPDGKSFVYVAHRNPSVILRHHLATGLDETLMTIEDAIVLIEDWSNDGKTLIGFTAGERGFKIVLLSVDKPGLPEFLSPAGASVDEFDLSPDGQLFVYQSFHAPDWEIVLQSRDNTAPPIRLGQGLQPRFAPDGKSIYYLSVEGAMMQIPVPASPNGGTPLPTLLFNTGLDEVSSRVDQYRIGRDGERFLLMRPVRNRAEQVQIVRPWYNLLDARN